MNNINDVPNLRQEDKDFYQYLQLNALRSNNTLPPEGLNELVKITLRENRSKNLEDLYQKVIRNEVEVDAYNSIYEDYKTELEQSINDTINGKVDISEGSKKLIDYFKLEIKRFSEELTPDDTKKLEELRQNNQKVRTLEEAHKRVNEKQIPPKVLMTIRDKYKDEIKEEIKGLGLKDEDYLPDDSIVYTRLAAIKKEEAPKEAPKSTLLNIQPVLNIKKEAPKEAVQEDVLKEAIDEKMPSKETSDDKLPTKETNDDTLYDEIAIKEKVRKSLKKENDNSELLSENKRLREENELLKTKIDFLKEQIRELNRDIAIQVNREEMPREYIELAKYFKLDLKRARSEISDEEMNDLRELTRGNNPMINEIENIVRMKANGELTIKEYNEEHNRVYQKYKTELEEKYNSTKKAKTR